MSDKIFYGGVLSEATVKPKKKIEGWQIALGVYILLVLIKKVKK
jgi:hypothetical protein